MFNLKQAIYRYKFARFWGFPISIALKAFFFGKNERR